MQKSNLIVVFLCRVETLLCVRGSMFCCFTCYSANFICDSQQSLQALLLCCIFERNQDFYLFKLRNCKQCLPVQKSPEKSMQQSWGRLPGLAKWLLRHSWWLLRCFLAFAMQFQGCCGCQNIARWLLICSVGVFGALPCSCLQGYEPFRI